VSNYLYRAAHAARNPSFVRIAYPSRFGEELRIGPSSNVTVASAATRPIQPDDHFQKAMITLGSAAVEHGLLNQDSDRATGRR